MKTTLFGLCAVLACFAEAATEDADEWNAVAANRNLAGLTTALLARDASAAKPFFAFPVARPGLLPDIGEEEFESYFPVLFDDGFFAAFEPEAREKGTNLWEQIGWHGFFAPGLQSADARLVTDVSYESEKEKTRRKTFERVEILTLSPLLQEGVARPRSSFQTEDAGWRGRLDEMTNGTMRIALWRRGRSLSSVPDATCVVECIAEGSGGNCSFRPAGKAGCAPFAGLEKNVIGCDETPPLELLLCEKPGETNRLSATFVSWQKLRLAQSATEPSPIVPERQEADLGLTLHPSLTRTEFRHLCISVQCFLDIPYS